MVKNILLAVAAGEAAFIIVDQIQQKKMDKLSHQLILLQDEIIDRMKRLVKEGNENFTSVEEWKDLASKVLFKS